APVQSHVETEGEEAHGVGFYEKRAQRAAARAIDAMPHPRWVSARRSTPSNRSSRPAARGCAATRHDRRDPPSTPRTARRNQTPSRAILHAIRRTDTNRSIEEAERVAAIVESLIAPGVSWVNARGEATSLTLNDILIVAPYNAQVSQIAERIPGARIGTVDNFQGQEAPSSSTR